MKFIIKGINLIPVFKDVAKVLVLVIIPFLLFYYFGREGVLYLIVYLQFLLIWCQAEISLRQNQLHALQYEPFFKVTPNITIGNLFIENLSKNPAYSVGIQRVLDQKLNPIPASQWVNKLEPNLIEVLVPKEKRDLWKHNNLDFLNELFQNELTIEIGYTNSLNEINTIAIKGTKEGKILQLNPPFRKPGFLLNTFESISSFIKFIWYFRIRKPLYKK